MKLEKMKKYELIDPKEFYGKTLYRVRALRDFGPVEAGNVGGYVESEHNLSHSGTAWVCDNAKVYGDARVYGNAEVSGNAEVYGDAWVYGNARVYDNAEVYGYANVYSNAWVCGNAEVGGDAEVYGDARVGGDAEVYGNAEVYGDAKVYGDAEVGGDARVGGDAEVYGDARVGGDARVSETADYIVFKNWWSSGRYFTWTRSNNKWRVGCFYGTADELVAKAYKDSELSGREYERIVNYVKSILDETC